ncbi:tetratricopeptide (TPR) repeat protein [Stakelama sediminis]|uniref:Tetratricopeptide (TPR) repeat protein n=1 Tax=Stakelama sediminis TaxID=463200 RepID=A0A840YUQ2_9SPHN|nr:energy transducer TonB [Stakelama sediminis]MBB5717255.1 tetratricopeptide (TPR) repeat protein [Stakelama sediminis]
MQQIFDAASKAAAAGDCAKAITLFSSIENSSAVQKNTIARAAIGLRKGGCLIRRGDLQQGRDMIEAAIPVLSDKPNFKFDVADAYLALGKAAYYTLNFDAAKRALRKTRALLGDTPTLDTMIWSARATMFDKGDDAINFAARALAIAKAQGVTNKDVFASLQTLHARALLNQGQADAAYKELKKALDAQGGLGLRVNVADIVTRSDLALAALLDDKAEDARKFLAYTGAGRLEHSPFDTARVVDSPACGGENGLSPDDSAVIQFSIGNDGTVGFAQPIYSSRHGNAAAVFAKAVSDWSWQPKTINKIPPVLRAAMRVEIRCTMSIKRPNIYSIFQDALSEWLAGKGVKPLDSQEKTLTIPALKAKLASREKDSNPLAPVPVLLALADHPYLDYAPSKVYFDRARALVEAAKPNLLTQLYFSTSHHDMKEHISGKDYRRALRALLDHPNVQANAKASAALELMIARPYWHAKAPDDQVALLNQVVNDPRLDKRDPLRVNALVQLANAQADNGNLKAAQASYQQTGLSAQQCALMATPPTLRHSSYGANDYPTSAQKWGFAGWVMTEFNITADGHTAEQRALISYPPFVFDNAATGIVKRSLYTESYRPDGNLGCGGERQSVHFQNG